eukprot:12344244-Alexandrium_andersonii.AAC.1
MSRTRQREKRGGHICIAASVHLSAVDHAISAQAVRPSVDLSGSRHDISAQAKHPCVRISSNWSRPLLRPGS